MVRRMRWRLLWAVLGVGTPAWAQAGTSVSLKVELGATEAVPVGYAKGLLCDDLSVADVALKDGDKDNRLEVTGTKLGGTLCRVGLDPVGPAYFVTVTVVPKKTKPNPRKASPPPVVAPPEPPLPAHEGAEKGSPSEEAPAPAKVPEEKPKAPSDGDRSPAP